jgi:arylsulfatase A-like enzyme
MARWVGTSAGAESALPNVLLIVLDTVRAKSLGLYGGPQRTPWLEGLARSGVRFDRAIATAPWTTPSHASMFTARFPHELSADWDAPLDDAQPTLAEVLSGHGYMTAGFVGNVTNCGYASGLARGFVHYAAATMSAGELIESSSLGRYLVSSPMLRQLIGYYDLLGRKSAREVNGEFLEWLAGSKDDRPFFVFLNYFDAHAPYLPPPSGDAVPDHHPPRRNPFLLPDSSWPEAEIQAELDAYQRTIAGLDQQLAALFAALRERHLLDQTIVILTADHGEEFGAHSLFEHGNSLYFSAIHVPLIISFPARVQAGMVVHAPVSLRQIPATVLDLVGLGGSARFAGDSLGGYLDGGERGGESPLAEVSHAANLPDWYPVSRGGLRSLVMGDYQYIVEDDGTERLFLIDQVPLARPAPADAAAHAVLEQARSMLGVELPAVSGSVAASVVSPP